MSRRLGVLVLGGYGTFGGRLVHRLANEAGLRLIVAGRSAARAEAFAASIAGAAEIEAATVDRDGDVAAALRRLAPDIVVDASGPFQAYGERPYRVVEAALALGIGYLDLADGSDFVAGIAAFDEAARRAGVFAIAGASTYPALTAAAVGRLAEGLTRLDTVAAGIAPSPRAGYGINVVRASASYAGQPVQMRRAGREVTARALTDVRRYTVAPPGRVPLRRRRFSMIDAPDLAELPRLWPELRTVWVGVGPTPGLLLAGLNLLARAVSAGLLGSLSPFAGLFHWALNTFAWGEHRGGMFVELAGLGADGGAVTRSWHLLAEGDAGPYVPTLAVAALVRRVLAGRLPAPGARSAAGEVTLADYEGEFAALAIASGCREESAATHDLPLYRRILGEAYERLPAPIRALHDLHGALAAEGRGSVERGGGLLARLVAAAVGFPPAGAELAVRVAFSIDRGVEHWQRDFAGHAFASRQMAGRGREAHLIVERFGPLAFALAPAVEEGRLSLAMRGWRCFGLPLPLLLAPRIAAWEHAADDRFNFHVEIRLPLAGLIVRYRGWLRPCA